MTLIDSSGLKSVTPAAPNTFCGIFLHKKQSGDLIPLARSYHGQDWESAPGPLACPSKDVTSTSVLLPDLQDPNDEYVVLTKAGTMDNKKQIASFLEMTTFGPKMSEIEALDNLPSWGTEERAQYVRDQMDMDATSHREYFRKRTNSKWDATAQPARSSHPCSPNSKWRRYSYTRQDRYDTISSQYIVTEYETVAEEADLTYTIHEADSVDDVKSYGSEVNTWSSGQFSSSQVGFSGTGYYDMGGTGDHIEFEVNIAQGDMYPISFRFAMGSSYEGGNRPCKLSVNGNTVVEAYDFVFTDSWRYYMYSNLIDVQLNPGLNTIRVDVGEAGGGPNIDHLRIGKPPAVVMKSEFCLATCIVISSCYIHHQALIPLFLIIHFIHFSQWLAACHCQERHSLP